MKRIQIGPFHRVEGDLEISLDIDAGKVQAARVNSPLFRGFEQVLIGRPPADALAIVPRICGICSVAQSAAAASALVACGKKDEPAPTPAPAPAPAAEAPAPAKATSSPSATSRLRPTTASRSPAAPATRSWATASTAP